MKTENQRTEANDVEFRMYTKVNGLEIVTGRAEDINFEIRPERKPGLYAYLGDDPYVTFVSDTPEGKRTFTGVQGSYQTFQEAIEGHSVITTIGLENPDRIRHSLLIRKMADDWKEIMEKKRDEE